MWWRIVLWSVCYVSLVYVFFLAMKGAGLIH